jgi:hypothetical protein
VRRWEPAAPIPCPIHVDFVPDESGSVQSVADPIRYRHALLARFVEWIGRRCRCGECSVSLTLFDLAVQLPPTRLDRPGRLQLATALASMPYTSSCASSALAAVDTPAFTARRPLLVVLSDFQLFDPDTASITATLARRRALAIVLGEQDAPLVDESDITVDRVTHRSPPTALVDAISDRLTGRQ